jgi:hypothetical protein
MEVTEQHRSLEGGAIQPGGQVAGAGAEVEE